MVPVLEYIAERRAFREQDRDMTHAAHTGCEEKKSSKAGPGATSLEAILSKPLSPLTIPAQKPGERI